MWACVRWDVRMQRKEGERGGARMVLSMIVLVDPRKYKSYCPTKK